ncbi:hypothetical protein [uncultured Sphaerotilus sp.]|uniref:hypothetical protein n=1 Tax=uncultured Sphaerotilus sp. TaxID=474984 RepID=UPI0030CA3A00
MQTTPENGKGRRVTSATTPMQTGADATAGDQRQQLPAILTPRARRILLALLVRDRTREEIDRAAGASNGPDEVLRIRQRFGLAIPCTRKGSKDRDGQKVEIGVYRLTEDDRPKARRVLGSNAIQGVQ